MTVRAADEEEAMWVREQRCYYCGNQNAAMRPNPFAQEVGGDDTEHWMCDDCYQRSIDEI